MPDAGPLRLDREAAGRYVLSRHTPGSGYSYYRTPDWGVEEPNPPDTLAALRTLRLLGLPVPEPQATAAWLATSQADDGGFPTLTIGWAVLGALHELGERPPHPLSPAWLTGCARVLDVDRRRDWAGALRAGLHLAELCRFGRVPVDTAAVRRLLERARDPDGGWAGVGADLETTAVAVLLADRAGLARVVRQDAVGFLRRCDDPALGLRIRPESGASSVGGLWGGAVISARFGARLGHPDRVSAGLALAQGTDGGLGPRHRAVPTLHDTWLGVAADVLLHPLPGPPRRRQSYGAPGRDEGP